MSDNITKRVGLGTAYGFAKAGGYEGTVEEFTELLGNIAIDLARIENLSVTVTTLPAGSQATASLNGSVLSLGIPKGDKGDKGNTGDTGSPAGFGTVSATVDANIGTPSVEVTASGSDTAKNFAFAFHNLKGQKGDKGDTGEVSEAELTQAFEDFSANGTVANAEQLTTDIRANDQTPYLFRTAGGSVDIGDREYINGIVGGTVAFNQIFKSPGNGTLEGVTVTRASDWSGCSFSGTSTNTCYFQTQTPRTIIGHVYYVDKGNDNTDYQIYNDNAGVGTTPEKRYAVGKATANNIVYCWLRKNVTFDNMAVTPQVFDLTQMFGSTIADYIYSLEQATAGAGVAFFKTLFPKPYYAYNAGELMSVRGLVSHDMVGFNAFDKSTMVVDGYYITDATGSAVAKEDAKCTDFIPVVGGMSYYINTEQTSAAWGAWYDADKNFISECVRYYGGGVVNAPSNARYVRLTIIYPNNNGNVDTFCFNLSWDGSEDGNYEPYQKWSYPLDSDLELRGIPKIENGNLYYDGDVYEADGTVTRKYGIVDLGTLTWYKEESGTYPVYWSEGIKTLVKNVHNQITCLSSKYVGFPNMARTSLAEYATNNVVCITSSGNMGCIAIRDDGTYADTDAFKAAVSGVYLVYPLATPTTETADPYTNPQIVDDFGTEEFVISNTVAVPIPVGHNTDYPVNLKAKVEMAPNSPDGNGDYIVRQTNGTNEYVALANNATIQNILARLEALEG